MENACFQRIAKALADPRRVDILARIAAADEVTCKALVEQMPISQPTVSHHLKELAAAGLLNVREDGVFHHYRLRRETFQAYMDELAGLVNRPIGLASGT